MTKIITCKTADRWERFPGTEHLVPANIARLLADGVWTWRDLQKNGLQAAEPFELPSGKRIVPGTTERFSEDGKAQIFDIEDAPPEPPVVPKTISPLQARKALRAMGLKDAVDRFIDQLPEEEREEWEYAVEIHRNNPTLAKGATEFGLGDDVIDQLFILGATYR